MRYFDDLFDAVMATVEGDCADKANVLERLEYYMLSNMIN